MGRSSTDTSQIKLNRASQLIKDLSTLLNEKPPFTYVLQTNVTTGERATLAKRNDVVAARAAAVAGDATHNLRSSLDHVYWSIVSPFAKTPAEQRKVQFPFCERADRLEAAVKGRLGDRAGTRFFNAVRDLRPFAEAGGNRTLYLVELMDIPDKHRTLLPVGDYTRISTDMIRRQIPDFPSNIHGTMAFGSNHRDVVWTTRGPFPNEQLGQPIPPTTDRFERMLDVPVQAVFAIPELHYQGQLVETLSDMVAATRQAIAAMRDAAQ